MQAVVTELHAALLRNVAPERYGDAVPTAQAAFQPGRLRGIEVVTLVRLCLDLALRQRHDEYCGRSAIEAECRQFGVIGVRREHHDAALRIIRVMQCVERGGRRQAAVSPLDQQLAPGKHIGLSRDIQIAPTRDTALEILPVIAEQNLRVEPVAEPAAAQLDFEDQGLASRQWLAQLHAAIAQRYLLPGSIGREAVLVVIVWRIEEMIGQPGLMRDPAEQQQAGQQPPGEEHAKYDEQERGRE
ncbi:MAG: hypothetical protein AW09_002648 [Candidatus Accumulibacter phosphatis]|uniref:Uncharacterized protein n=1 Tax=Candidatus Accumulibacter phosphatis TaxID=327160 RepID=A0A080M536_9PROT|nr:MAG: hypothetical protein AW09_002648 [Candidatus Accumulibacter phosphatis]